MNIDELTWYTAEHYNGNWAEFELGGVIVEVWRAEDFPKWGYNIFTWPLGTVAPRGLGGTCEQWRNVDALTLQSILHYLEGNDDVAE